MRNTYEVSTAWFVECAAAYESPNYSMAPNDEPTTYPYCTLACFPRVHPSTRFRGRPTRSTHTVITEDQLPYISGQLHSLPKKRSIETQSFARLPAPPAQPPRAALPTPFPLSTQPLLHTPRSLVAYLHLCCMIYPLVLVCIVRPHMLLSVLKGLCGHDHWSC